MAERKLSHGRSFGLHRRPQTDKVLRILACEKNAQILPHSKLLLGSISLPQYDVEALETFSALTSLTSWSGFVIAPFIVECLSQTIYVINTHLFPLGCISAWEFCHRKTNLLICWALSFSRQLVLMSPENTNVLTYLLPLTINLGYSVPKRSSKCYISHPIKLFKDRPASILSNFWKNIPPEPSQISQLLQTMNSLWWILSYILPCFQLTKIKNDNF